MKRRVAYIFLWLCVLCMTTDVLLQAQSVRSIVSGGNDLFKEKKYADAEAEYRKALEKEKDIMQGSFNLGDALHKQQRYDEAIQSYDQALEKTTDKKTQAQLYHNIGNAYVESKQFQEGINAYKNSLKSIRMTRRRNIILRMHSKC